MNTPVVVAWMFLAAVQAGAGGPGMEPVPRKGDTIRLDVGGRDSRTERQVGMGSRGSSAEVESTRVEKGEKKEIISRIGPGERLGYWHEANKAYEKGDYEKATRLYLALASSGLENGHLYYNLGNSLIRSGRLGKAVAWYLRSRILLPRDQDVAANLEFARKSVKDALEPIEPSPVLETLFFWHYALNLKETLMAAAAASLVFWMLMLLRLFRKESELTRWIAAAALVLLVAFSGSIAARYLAPTRVAVITVPTVEVKSATSGKATVLFELHEGTEAVVERQEPGWVRIRVSDGKRGWVRQDYVELVGS